MLFCDCSGEEYVYEDGDEGLEDGEVLRRGVLKTKRRKA